MFCKCVILVNFAQVDFAQVEIIAYLKYFWQSQFALCILNGMFFSQVEIVTRI